MSIEKAVGYPDYTFSGTNKNIPILFAGKTLEKFYASTMMSEITMTDYVGEVKNVGDKVYIRTVPNITISDYKKGSKLNLEHPESAAVEFTVDYAKYFNFALDDIDTKQFDIPMLNKWADDAAQQIKLTLETHVFSAIYPDASSYNRGLTAGYSSGNINLGVAGTPVQITKANILDKLVDMNLCLDELNIPETDRFCVLPPWAIALIKKSDLKDAAMTGDSTSVLRTGRIGRIDRFNIYSSNLLTKVVGDSAWYAYFGHKSALAFVSQLTKVETYRPQDTFADAMKGLNVYGFKVLQPTAFGVLYAKQ